MFDNGAAPMLTVVRSGRCSATRRLETKIPQHDAGIRIEPPLDPAVVRSGFQGLRDGPNSSGSVNGVRPNSGVFVFPTTITPARFRRRTYSLACGAIKSRNKRLALVMRSPACHAVRSLSRIGTPLNGPSGNVPCAALRAAWYILCTIALSGIETFDALNSCLYKFRRLDLALSNELREGQTIAVGVQSSRG